MLLPFTDFLTFIKDKSVAIVGPAEISSIKDISPEIDAHDVVVRINTYHSIIGKTNYGRKVDVVCFNMWSGSGGIPVVDINNSPQWILNTHKLIYNKVNNTANFNKSVETYPNIFHTIFPEKTYHYLRTFPTSGFCVVDQFLFFLKQNYIKQLSIYGISLNLTSYDASYRAFVNIVDKVAHHNFAIERNYIKELYNSLTIEQKNRLFIENQLLVHFFNNNDKKLIPDKKPPNKKPIPDKKPVPDKNPLSKKPIPDKKPPNKKPVPDKKPPNKKLIPDKKPVSLLVKKQTPLVSKIKFTKNNNIIFINSK